MKKINPGQSVQNPKKKIIIGLSIVTAVIVVVTVAATLVDPPLFKGALRTFVRPVVTDTIIVEEDLVLVDTKVIPEVTDERIVLLDTKLDTKIVPEVTDERIVIDADTKSEESDETFELAPVSKEAVLATPPKLAFAYIDRLDLEYPSIYGTVARDSDQVVLIFRIRNMGSMPAYLKSFNTVEYGCDKDNPCLLASNTGKLKRLNYDNSGDFPDYTDRLHVADLGRNPFFEASGDADDGSMYGYFGEDASTNHSLLEITGNSDTYFAVTNDTSDYFTGPTYDTKVIYAQAFIELPTLEIVDSNGVDFSTSIYDSADPGIMTFYNPRL